MSLISWIKNLFAKEEAVKAEVKVIAEEVAPVAKEVVEKVAEVAKEEPTKKIEERLAEVAKEEKVTAREIKAKAKRPAKAKVETPVAEVKPVKVTPKPRRKPAPKKPKGE
jgi:hypothetical protein